MRVIRPTSEGSEDYAVHLHKAVDVYIYQCLASLVAQLVEDLPAVQEIWVQLLGWEDPLEKGKTTHSSILAWRIPRGSQSDTTE